MKRVIAITAMLLMLAAMAGCSKAVADEKADEPQQFEKVSDSAKFVPSEKPADVPESEPEPISDEVSDEDEYVSDNWDSEDYSGLEYAEDYGYADYDYTPDYSSYNTDGPSHTMPGYYDGHIETYYSSNVLYHYRTDEWTPDSEGFYRDDDGYYIVGVGINDGYELGDVIDTGKGKAIVSDFGTATNDVDFYTNW